MPDTRAKAILAWQGAVTSGDTLLSFAEWWEYEGRHQREPFRLPNPCIHTPSRCNGGGYDGCACGPYPKEARSA